MTGPHPCARPILVGRAGAGLSASSSDPKSPWEEEKFLQLGKGRGGRGRREVVFQVILRIVASAPWGMGLFGGRQSQWMGL